MSDDVREGTTLDVVVERPVAGGAMLARHHGRVVLVVGAIPGERVRARVVRTRRDVIHATAEEVIEPHAARRPVQGDPACGGQVYRHIAYRHQLALKADVIRDALERIARLQLAEPPAVASSTETGYRMRARLRVGPQGLGFLREGSHEVCDAVATGQMLPETGKLINELSRRLGAEARRAVAHVDIAENLAADQRVVHVHLRRRVSPTALSEWTGGLSATGVTADVDGNREIVRLAGVPTVSDPMALLVGDPELSGSLVRHAPSFYQSNRHLLPALVAAVHDRVDPPVLDLYAGVGVFAVTLAARGVNAVMAVEREPCSVLDLESNVRAVGTAIEVGSVSVEAYLERRSDEIRGTVIVDPPRVGLSRRVIERLSRLAATRVVYVSCDVATFARDLRRFMEQGFAVNGVRAFDMFPNTPHIELVATLLREPARAEGPYMRGGT